MKVRIRARRVTSTAEVKVPYLLGILCDCTCEPIKLVVLCHIVYVKLTGREGKTHGKYAGKHKLTRHSGKTHVKLTG